MFPVLGYKRVVLVDGTYPLTYQRPFFGFRIQWLPMINRWAAQLLVKMLLVALPG